MAYLYPWGNTQQLNLDWILQKIKDIEAGAGGADLDEISNALLAASYAAQAYEQFDIVFYDGKLYMANADIPAPGEAWTPAHWDEILLGGPVSALLKHATNLSSDNVINDSQVTGDTVSDALDTLKNASDAAVTNVRYNAGYLKKTIGGTDSNIIQIEDTPTSDSSKLPSSKAVYNLISALNAAPTMEALILNTDDVARGAGYVIFSPNTHIAIVYGRADNYHDGAFNPILNGKTIFTVPNDCLPAGHGMVAATIVMMDGTTSTYQLEMNTAGQIFNNYSANVKSVMFVGAYGY